MARTDHSSPVTADRRPWLLAAYHLAATAVAGVRGEQLLEPTPCPAFDVAALVDHLVGAGWRAVALGRGEVPTAEGAFPHVELADAPGELRRAGTEAEAVWSAERLGAMTTMPWGETYAGWQVVDIYLSELMAHTWDLAVATGQVPACDEELATAALVAARSMLKPHNRDAAGPGSPFGPEQEAGDEASTLERFVAFMGRRPDWRP